jgi:hypothetical protein
MRGTNKAKEMRRRASQRRATHKARRAALSRRTKVRMAAVEAEKDRKRSSRPTKTTAKAAKPKKK